MIYIDGAVARTRAGNGKLTTDGNPMSIATNNPAGMQLIGLIDQVQVRVMSAARSAAQICADAGKPSCP